MSFLNPCTQRRLVRVSLTVGCLVGLALAVSPGAAQDTDTKAPRTSVRRLPVPDVSPDDELDPSSPSGAMTPRQLYDRVLKSVVMIVNGDITGTGWVVDAEKRLIMTNQHVVATSEKVEILFPTYRSGKLKVDLDFYRELTPVEGVVVDSMGDVDLALIQVSNLPSRTEALELASESASPGERVHAIGGLPQGSQGLWKYSTGSVSLVSSGKGVGLKGRVMQSNIDINPGNSGGAIVNDQGQVVGVSKSINLDARDVSYNVDVEAVREYLTTVSPLLDSEDPKSIVELGRRHLDAGRTAVAMRRFTDAIRRDPKCSEAHAQRGWGFIAQSDYVTAIADFGTSIELDHNNSTAWYGRGRAHRLMGENEEALKDLSSGIANDPENGIVYNERALVQEALGKYDLAMRDYDRGVELAPNNAQIIANRADLMVTVQRYDDALTEIRKALELNSENAWFYNVLGLAHYRKQEYQPAADAFVRATELNPESATYVANLGDAWQMMGDHQRSIHAWNKAIELDNSNAYYFYSRAYSWRPLGELQSALQDVNAAIERKQDYAAAIYYRGLIQRDLGDQASADRDFARAAELDPDQFGGNQQNNSSPAPAANGNRVVGTWFVNQVVDTKRFEMTQTFFQDGSYQAEMYTTENGNRKRTDEKGTYRLEGNQIVFDTNLGKYQQEYKFEDGMLWTYFSSWKVWLGSVPKN